MVIFNWKYRIYDISKPIHAALIEKKFITVCVHKVGKLKRDVHLDFSFNHLWLYETYACDADRRVWGWPQEGSALIEVCFTTEVTSRPLQGTSLKTLIIFYIWILRIYKYVYGVINFSFECTGQISQLCPRKYPRNFYSLFHTMFYIFILYGRSKRRKLKSSSISRQNEFYSYCTGDRKEGSLNPAVFLSKIYS